MPRRPAAPLIDLAPARPGGLDAPDLKHIRSFLAVARAGSFSGAAEDLFLTQQAVSAHVQRLEHRLGVPLLRRTTRTVSLTAAGEEFARTAAAAVADLDEVWDRTLEVGSGAVGTVHAGMSPAAGNEVGPDLVDAVARRLPGIEVVLHEMPPMDVIDGIRSRALDVGLALEPPAPHGLDGLALIEGTIAALVARKLAISRKRRLTIADVQPLTLIVPTETANPHLHACALRFAEANALVRTAAAVGSTTLPRAVYRGTAFALWPTVSPRRYAPADLAVVPFSHSDEPVGLWLLFRADDLSPAATKVVTVARERWPASGPVRGPASP